MELLNYRRRVIGYISVLLLLVVVAVKSYGQEGEIKWGQSFEDSKSAQAQFLKKDVTGDTYWLSNKNERLFISVFNRDNVKVASWPLSLPLYKGIDESKLYYSRVVVIKDKIVFLMRYIDDKKGKVEELLVQSSMDGDVSNSVTHVADFTTADIKGGALDDIIVSPDATKFIVTIVIQPRKGQNQATCFANVYSASMNKLLSRDYLLPEGYSLSDYKNYMALDKDNNIFFLTNKAQGYARHCIVVKLDAVSQYGDQFYPMDELSAKTINYIGLNASKQGDVTVSGFYQDRASMQPHNYYSGVFFGAITTGEPLQIKTTALNNEEKLNTSNPDLLWKDVSCIAKDDGGVILLSEQQFIDRGNQSYGNVLAVNLDNDGTLIYAKTLLKDQLCKHGPNAECYYSYYHHYIEDSNQLLLVYNDNPKNGEQNVCDYQMTPKAAEPVMAVLDSNGGLTKSLVYTQGVQVLCPLFTAELSDNKFLVWGKRGTTFRLGALTIGKKGKFNRDVKLHSGEKLPNAYGLRLRGNDGIEKRKAFTGIELAAVRPYVSKSNGVSVGLLGNSDHNSNGLCYGTFFSAQQKVNGITISPCFAGAKVVNGLAIGGIAAYSNDIHGAVLAPIAGGNVYGVAAGMAVVTDEIKGIGLSAVQMATGPSDGFFCSVFAFSKIVGDETMYNSLKGVAIAGEFTNIDEVKGVTISFSNTSKEHAGLAIGGINVTQELHGVQLGLFNYAANNPKGLRLLPFINMHLRS